ncbi:MAG: DegT/DnrJ/EryC1/StrS family aminotransferase [Myxococcales bacterium]|nr:DegT/DnrJ/EryC1/StrS family aminotransferase [Myxococcales bacterium]
MSERPVPFIDLAAQTAAYRDELDSAIARVIDHGRFILGPEVAALEQQLATYAGADHCVSCASGTDALVLALRALDIGVGHEVVVPALSFGASAEAVALVGARPVCADVARACFTLDPDQIERRLSPGTRAIMAVGLFGQPAQMDALAELAARHDVVLIDDAAQSFGGAIGARRVGTLATVTATSFFPAKPLGCFGDGGALFCQDEALAKRLRVLRAHGQRPGERYQHAELGTNSRLDTLQAAVLSVKLSHFDDELARRAQNAARYDELLDGAPLSPPRLRAGVRSSFAQYTVRLERDDPRWRDALRARLAARGIPTQVYYPAPLHHQAAFAAFHDGADLPVAEALCRDVLSLPFCAFIDADTQRRVCEALREELVR